MSTWPSLPAAMQKVAEVHDTDVRAPPGTTCRLHALPSHISAPAPAALELDPTASQKRAETHDTPARLSRRPLVARAGFGVLWIFQIAPFHASARETVARPERSGCEPTASQKTAETQDTALRLFAAAPGGRNAGWICQVDPFHDSARATGLDVSWKSPPASHAAASAQDTASRTVKVAPGGFGVGCTAHEVPFHVAARLRVLPEPSVYSPTASQNAAFAQDTVRRLVDVDPTGLGIGCALQADPFHISLPLEPMAAQKVTETHETGPMPVVSGTAWSSHVVPFHRAANGPTSTEVPVASQNVGETHDTPAAKTNVEPTRLGRCCRRQEVPSHVAAKARFFPPLMR